MKYTNYLIPAFLFIGIGLGILFHQVAAGTIIGLGVGMLFYFILGNKKPNTPQHNVSNNDINKI